MTCCARPTRRCLASSSYASRGRRVARRSSTKSSGNVTGPGTVHVAGGARHLLPALLPAGGAPPRPQERQRAARRLRPREGVRLRAGAPQGGARRAHLADGIADVDRARDPEGRGGDGDGRLVLVRDAAIRDYLEAAAVRRHTRAAGAPARPPQRAPRAPRVHCGDCATWRRRSSWA